MGSAAAILAEAAEARYFTPATASDTEPICTKGQLWSEAAFMRFDSLLRGPMCPVKRQRDRLTIDSSIGCAIQLAANSNQIVARQHYQPFIEEPVKVYPETQSVLRMIAAFIDVWLYVGCL